MQTFDIGKTDQQWGNISLRLQEWDASLQIFRDNVLFGVGPGDFKAELVKRYESNGWTVMAKERFDSHNQFIQTLGSLGILGFAVLTIIFAVSFRTAVINRDLLFILFLASFIVFSLTESTLEVQKGIVFFTFFNSFFFFSKNTLNQKNFINT
jgi:O-antigen ligase